MQRRPVSEKGEVQQSFPLTLYFGAHLVMDFFNCVVYDLFITADSGIYSVHFQYLEAFFVVALMG
jgi:hypothetical protein